MSYVVNEVLQFVKENDVKFIRLAFCDIFGVLKNISIMPGELPRAFQSGISFDASAINGFMNIEESDLLLFPDPSTLSILPWRPSQGRVARFFCNITHPNKEPFEGDGRSILKKAVKKATDMGYICHIGSECEFYLFKNDENGIPTNLPIDNAGYFDVAPLDKSENIRREICLTLEEMGIEPESSHHEQGPGQNEVDFKYSDAIYAADHLITFKSVVKTIASINGLYASFLPKPLPENSGSGLHINISLSKNGTNIFAPNSKNSPEADHFIAGILNRIREITVFLNPLNNSYERFGSFEAPKYITWSHQNRSPLIRIPAAEDEFARMELRSPDPACNPHLAFALLIYAGIEGVENKQALTIPSDINLFEANSGCLDDIPTLPENLGEAIKAAQNSSFIKQHLPQKTVEKYIKAKVKEWDAYNSAIDKALYQNETYFHLI